MRNREVFSRQWSHLVDTISHESATQIFSSPTFWLMRNWSILWSLRYKMFLLFLFTLSLKPIKKFIFCKHIGSRPYPCFTFMELTFTITDLVVANLDNLRKCTFSREAIFKSMSKSKENLDFSGILPGKIFRFIYMKCSAP